MKHLSRFLCLLLMLALLLPGALAEAVEQTEQIDSGIEEDEVEKVGDIFDMYQVGSMVEANGKLYTISYGPTCCASRSTAATSPACIPSVWRRIAATRTAASTSPCRARR